MYHVIIICDNVVKIDDGIQRICVEERDKNMSGDTVLKAWMLGREDVTYGDKSILTGRNSMTKATKLLLYIELLLYVIVKLIAAGTCVSSCRSYCDP